MILVKNTDTARAGDYFFAYFMIKFLKTQNPIVSDKYAVENTSKFLLPKVNS